MKGDYASFSHGKQGINATKSESGYVNGVDYNPANSKSVGVVQSIQTVVDAHTMPVLSTPNSVTRNYQNGTLKTERYYDSNGEPYLDIDYTDHGNPKMHPVVPHEHKVAIVNGNLDREKKDRRIQ